jgi:dienelactone hydrolase
VRSLSCTQGQLVGLLGFSAGGHLASIYTCTHSNPPDRLITVGAPLSLEKWAKKLSPESLENFMGDLTDETIWENNPINYVSPVPQLSIWGSNDLFFEAMDIANYTRALVKTPKFGSLVFPDGDHLMSNKSKNLAALVKAWL